MSKHAKSLHTLPAGVELRCTARTDGGACGRRADVSVAWDHRHRGGITKRAVRHRCKEHRPRQA